MINILFTQLKFRFSAMTEGQGKCYFSKLKKERMKGTKRTVNQKGRYRERNGSEIIMKIPGKVKIWAMENFNDWCNLEGGGGGNRVCLASSNTSTHPPLLPVHQAFNISL